MRDLLEGLKNGLSERFKEVHLDCLADAGVDDAESLRAATFETLAKAGLPLVKAQLILDVTSSGMSQESLWVTAVRDFKSELYCLGYTSSDQ